MDGAIERWRCVARLGRKLLGLVTEKEVATCTGAGSNFRKVGSVAVNVEVHFAGNKPNGGVWMGGTVAEELGSMLAVSIFAFGVDTVLLRRILMVSKLAVGVLTLPL